MYERLQKPAVFTIHLVIEVLYPYSKFLFTQKMQKPEEYTKSFCRLCYFLHSRRGSKISRNKSEVSLMNFIDSGFTKRVKYLHIAMKVINSEDRNEFIRYMLECKFLKYLKQFRV